MQEDTHFKVLRLLESKPDISQRELADELGVSLGKANYCLKAIIDKGWVKARKFKNNNNKSAYRYLLTPKGISQKATIAIRFLNRKRAEYDEIKREIEALQIEIGQSE